MAGNGGRARCNSEQACSLAKKWVPGCLGTHAYDGVKMSWNYRILVSETNGEDYYAIHEVFYDDGGNPNGWTQEPIDFGGDSVLSVYSALRMAYLDIRRYPPLRIQGKSLVEEPRQMMGQDQYRLPGHRQTRLSGHQ